MTSLRPAWLEIDRDALAHNVRLHRRAAGSHAGGAVRGRRMTPPGPRKGNP
jgi:alanine racemase